MTYHERFTALDRAPTLQNFTQQPATQPTCRQHHAFEAPAGYFSALGTASVTSVYRPTGSTHINCQASERSTTLHHLLPEADRLAATNDEAGESEAWTTDRSLLQLSTTLLDQEEYMVEENEDRVSPEVEGSTMDKAQRRRKKNSEASARFRARKRQNALETRHVLEETLQENDLLRHDNLLLRNEVKTLRELLVTDSEPRCARHSHVASAEPLSHIFPSCRQI